jgi:cadmium resistance protein CadD (predicted permease)
MNPAIIGVFIPIIAILAGIAVAIVGMLANHRQRLQRTELRHRERLAAIEKGFELPPDPPDADSKAGDEARFLRYGLVLVAIGVTVTGAMMQIPDKDVPYLFGFIPAGIGIAYLLYYFIRTKFAANGPPPAPGAR